MGFGHLYLCSGLSRMRIVNQVTTPHVVNSPSSRRYAAGRSIQGESTECGGQAFLPVGCFCRRNGTTLYLYEEEEGGNDKERAQEGEDGGYADSQPLLVFMRAQVLPWDEEERGRRRSGDRPRRQGGHVGRERPLLSLASFPSSSGLASRGGSAQVEMEEEGRKDRPVLPRNRCENKTGALVGVWHPPWARAPIRGVKE